LFLTERTHECQFGIPNESERHRKYLRS